MTSTNACNVLIDNSKKTIKTITINKPYCYYMSILDNVGNTLMNLNNEQYGQLPKTIDVSNYSEFTIRGYNMQYNNSNTHKSFAECITMN